MSRMLLLEENVIFIYNCVWYEIIANSSLIFFYFYLWSFNSTELSKSGHAKNEIEIFAVSSSFVFYVM